MGAARVTPRSTRWRRVASGTLLVVGALLTVVSAGAVYARRELLNTDRYVATVAPLADDAAIRGDLSTYIVHVVYEHVDVTGLARRALPPSAAFLAAPLSDGLQIFSRQVVDRFLASGAFRALWVEANRLAHSQLVALLENRGRRFGPVTLRDGVVTVDLSKTIAAVQRRLATAGLSFVDAVRVSGPRAQYRLVSSKLLTRVRRYVAWFNAITWVLPVLTVVGFAGAVLLVSDRRRAALRVGVAVGAASGVVLVGLTIARGLYVDAATGPGISGDAAGAVFDTVLRSLRAAARVGIAVGAGISGAAWIAGPSPAARRTLDTIRAARGRLTARAEALGWGPGPVASYAATHRPVLRLAALTLVLAVFLAWHQPTIGVVVSLLVVSAVLVAVVEVIGRAGAGSVRERTGVPGPR